MGQCMIIRRGAEGQGPLSYQYTGQSVLTEESENAWNIKFLTSGTLTVDQNLTIDMFMCGGGSGGGAWNAADHGPGGGGGYTVTHRNIIVLEGTSYPIVIGDGGVGATSTIISGGATSGFGLSTDGGTTNRNSSNKLFCFSPPFKT